jgi:hypothetical protein
MNACLSLLWVTLFILPFPAGPGNPVPEAMAKTGGPGSRDAASMERKLRHLETNAAAKHPDPAPTEFTEKEINSYLASGNMEMPAGVKSVRLRGTPGIVTGSARVDFDQFRAGSGSSNPLLGIFSGIHDVVVIAHAQGSGGKATVHVDSVSLDGVEVPHFVLQLFVDNFVQPKYPKIGLDSQFDLPDRIDTATVGLNKLTVTQR